VHRGEVVVIGRGDDRGSLPLAMLLTLVGMMLSALLIPMVLNQVQSTRVDMHRLRALNAAQAGLDVALGHIRAANDGAGNGVLLELPCGPLTGTVGAGGTARYQVTIAYYDDDPRGHTDSTWLTAHRIACYPGGGADSTPAYALLRAQGTDSATGAIGSGATRTLQGTYTFSTSNENIVGGLIHIYKTSTSTDLCLDAGSGSPAAGTNVQLKPCVAGSIQQKFTYLSNLNLVLSNTVTSSSLGMCLDAGTPQAAGKVLAFQSCATTTKPQQQWSFNDNANFEGTADGSTLDGLCFNAQSPNVSGSFVILAARSASKCYGAYDNIQTFSPDAAVGAGAAGVAADSTGAMQLVNFKEFGRCLDVTGQNVTSTFLIAWPCKQAPNMNNVAWNQKWTLPSSTGTLYTTKSGTKYCLRSPLSTASGQYVTIVTCPTGTTPANLSWTVYTDTGTYATSYRIIDDSGYCLQPTDPTASPADLFASGNLISKIVVVACTASTLQKWNAPANIVPAPPLKDLGES
jgi:hypothetical protein